MLSAQVLERWSTGLGLNGIASGKVDLSNGRGLVVLAAGILLLLYVLREAQRGWWTLRAAALTPTLSRLLAGLVKTRDYSIDEFLGADGAAPPWVEVRKRAIDRLASFFQASSPKAIAWGKEIRDSFSDLRFTDANRVPFPFVRAMREKFNLCSVVTASDGPKLRDLDGNWTLDVSGSYGLNVAGFDRYKGWIEKGWERVKELGPVLGPLHPLVAENIALLKSISKMDEASFHMSGTEAVMAAVRLARFNTRRKLIVSFFGAYHGWWDGVQPGLGSERTITDCLTLKDVHPASLELLRHRAKEIAGVLVNPFQSFHPNSPPPNDTILLTSSVRKTEDSSSAYRKWLKQLREVCTANDIPLIFDEVYTGFRLGPGGAQEYFDVAADMVVYGKTVAGGMPIGVVCGKHQLMRRFDPAHPMRVAYIIGTFSAHPLVIGAMNEFLNWVVQPEAATLYRQAENRCAEWVRSTNQRLDAQAIPLHVVHLSTVWTIIFKAPSRYNWLLQYYMRAEGLTLSWVGTGRCLSSMDFSPEDYQDLQIKLLKAAQAMKADAWWLTEEQQPDRDKLMRSRLIREVASSVVRIPQPVQTFYTEISRRKVDDHLASHSNLVNQFFHLLSSSTFIYCYLIAVTDLTRAMFLGLAALFIRQFGHAILEPPSHDKEALLLGFNTRNKTLIVGGYLLIPIVQLAHSGGFSAAAFASMAPAIAPEWFLWTVMVVIGRVMLLSWKYDLRTSMIWFVKLVTDPFTDILAYYDSITRLLRRSPAQQLGGT
jgi:glutamate-1-semialdehyde 2,1-aminomutase